MHETEPDDAPLDPKVEAIRRKLVRLLVVSGGLMLLGFLAVFAAIVYRVNEAGDRAVAVVAEGEAQPVALPAGSTWLATAAAPGGGLLLTLRLATGETVIQRVDAEGRVIARWRLEPGR